MTWITGESLSMHVNLSMLQMIHMFIPLQCGKLTFSQT